MQELEKILEEIRKAFEENTEDIADEDGCHHFVVDSCTATYLVNKIIRKYMNDGWISVEKRPPIPNKEVWVTVKRNGKVFVSTDEMTEKEHFWNYGKENILAWKEKETIPEPYRPERSES